LLLEVREALNAYQEKTGKSPLGGGAYGLTAALPCGPANIDFLDVSFIAEALDELNLMTFDLHNERDPKTGANSPLFDQEWDEEPGLSVDGCVKNYRLGGVGDFAKKINIG
jgi:chitinase